MSESASPWPKRGLAGKVQAARSAAPDGASDMAILSVAWTAHEEGRDPADVWEEVEENAD